MDFKKEMEQPVCQISTPSAFYSDLLIKRLQCQSFSIIILNGCDEKCKECEHFRSKQYQSRYHKQVLVTDDEHDVLVDRQIFIHYSPVFRKFFETPRKDDEWLTTKPFSKASLVQLDIILSCNVKRKFLKRGPGLETLLKNFEIQYEVVRAPIKKNTMFQSQQNFAHLSYFVPPKTWSFANLTFKAGFEMYKTAPNSGEFILLCGDLSLKIHREVLFLHSEFFAKWLVKNTTFPFYELPEKFEPVFPHIHALFYIQCIVPVLPLKKFQKELLVEIANMLNLSLVFCSLPPGL